MFEDINAKLVEIQVQMRKRDKYQIQLSDYKNELKSIEGTLSQLRIQFESEQKDVRKLERISLANVIATLSGTKDIKLSKEKEEMILAQRRLVEAENTKKQIDDAILSLRDQLRNLENTEREYQQLLLHKETMIKESTSSSSAKVFEMSEREGTLKANITELREAIDAGSVVKAALSDAIRSFEKARNWGTWDMFGGGFISSMVKHQHIDQAEDELRRVQTSLRKFQKELQDVNEQVQLNIDISGMLKFADFFFDGLIVDYLVQNKINQALGQTENHFNKVTDVLLKLNDQQKRLINELESIQKEKREIIESLR